MTKKQTLSESTSHDRVTENHSSEHSHPPGTALHACGNKQLQFLHERALPRDCFSNDLMVSDAQ